MKHGVKKRIPNSLELIGSVFITVVVYQFGSDGLMELVISSDRLPDAMTGVITFTTLILGFIGVLLPAIMGMKKESELVEKFFKHISQKQFSGFIRSNIISGLWLTVITVIMFFANDLFENGFAKIAMTVGWATLFCSIYFVMTTFSVLNLLLRLLIEDNGDEAYPRG